MVQTNGSVNDITIVIGHPNVLLREGIIQILENAGFRVVGQAAEINEIENITIKAKPVILIIDTGIEGYCSEKIKELTQKTSAIITVITPPHNSIEASIALKSGAKGYLSVDQTALEFVRSLNVIARGDIIISREVSNTLIDSVVISKNPEYVENLTVRENEVLKYLGNGLTNREISERLFVSEHTIKAHLRNVLIKLNLRNRQQAAVFAAEHGLIQKDGDQENSSEAP